MAYLNKEQYAYRRESAAKKMEENKTIAVSNGLSEEQAETITELCSLRHELHTNMDRVATCDEMRIKARLVKLATKMNELGLSPIDGIPYGEGEYIDIDDIDLLYDMMVFEDIEDPEERDLKIDEEKTRIIGELEELNTKIEKWLAEIDKQYGTKYCPTGALRIF